MFTLQDQTVINAPIERCFLLSTSVAIVQRELGMHPAKGRVSGLVTAGDKILWKGWQLGLPQYHHSVISRFEPYRFFQDTMIAGRFKTFQHDHAFTPNAEGSITLADELRFSLPFGLLGHVVSRLIMVPHISGLLRRRFRLLKRIAESDEWREYLPGGDTHLTP